MTPPEDSGFSSMADRAKEQYVRLGSAWPHSVCVGDSSRGAVAPIGPARPSRHNGAHRDNAEASQRPARRQTSWRSPEPRLLASSSLRSHASKDPWVSSIALRMSATVGCAARDGARRRRMGSCASRGRALQGHAESRMQNGRPFYLRSEACKHRLLKRRRPLKTLAQPSTPREATKADGLRHHRAGKPPDRAAGRRNKQATREQLHDDDCGREARGTCESGDSPGLMQRANSCRVEVRAV